MLRAIRRTRLAALLTLLLLAGGVPLSVTALVHDDADDAICQPAFVVHNESAHRFENSRSVGPEAQHCYICHWLQSLRTIGTSTGLVSPVDDLRQFTSAFILVAGTPAFYQRSARAPPRS